MYRLESLNSLSPVTLWEADVLLLPSRLLLGSQRVRGGRHVLRYCGLSADESMCASLRDGHPYQFMNVGSHSCCGPFSYSPGSFTYIAVALHDSVCREACYNP
jgi:hypothetical protein